MAIVAACSKCGKAIKAPDNAAGKKGKCPACGAVIEIPARSTGSPSPATAPSARAGAAETDPMAALAAALGAAAGASPIEAAELVSPLADEVLKPPPAKPAPASSTAAKPVTARPVTAEPVASVPAAAPSANESDLIAVPPIGVQTPSGLPARPYSSGLAHQWQRRLAGMVRIAGLVLGGLSFACGMITMILMAQQGENMLMPGIGLFVIMFVVGAMSALGGLLLRHVLLLLADLGQGVRSLEDLLERISDRLG